jgi:hypothetical protein
MRTHFPYQIATLSAIYLPYFPDVLPATLAVARTGLSTWAPSAGDSKMNTNGLPILSISLEGLIICLLGDSSP